MASRSSSTSAPTAFSAYASKFLSNSRSGNDNNQIFRSSSPVSQSPDPFLESPAASQTHLPRSPGSSSSRSGTPPFPGVGIDGIPSIGDLEDSRSTTRASKGRLLFDAPEPPLPRVSLPDPSSESEDLEADLDHVAHVRRSLLGSKRRSRRNKGWMAYQSEIRSSSSESESEKETEEDTDDDRVGMMGQSRRKSVPTTIPQLLGGSETLEEPLLGPDQITQMTTKIPVRLQVYHGRFGHWEREGLRKYKDPGFLALWLTTILGVLIGLMFVWGGTDPKDERSGPPPSILSLLPILLALIVPTLILPPVFLFLLSKTVRPVLMGTAAAVPFSLFVCGWWAIGASFENVGDVDQKERWWATTGLRLGALVPWILAALFARLVWVRRRKLERTVSVVELSTQLLLSHPPLLLLTPLLLAAFAIASIPFMTLLIRLVMVGYWRNPRPNTWVANIQPYTGWLIFLITVAWIWTWGVLRGVGRVAVAAVIGEWYFHRDTATDPLEITVAAVHRASGTSLGSICLGALIVATVRVVGRIASELKRITSPRSKILPSALSFLHALTPILNVIAGILDQLNGYALVYVGITGDAFWSSARRAVGLASRRNSGKLLDYTLIKLLLTVASTATGIFTATAGYLYMAHPLHNPSYAPFAALLCGGVPFMAIRAGAAVLGDAADALFICHQIDSEAGGHHSDEAKKAFAGDIFRGDEFV